MFSFLPQIQLSYVLIIYFSCFLVTIGLAIYGVYELGGDGWNKTTLSFITIVFGVSLWNICRFFEYLFVSEQLTSFVIGLIYIGWSAANVPVLFFALAFSGRDHWLTRRVVAILIAPVFLMVIIALTNQYHELVWTGEFVMWKDWAGNEILIYDRNYKPGFFAMFAYNVGAALLGILLLLWIAVTSPDIYRRQSLAIVIGTAIAVITGTLFAIGRQPFVPDFLDLTPFGFVMMVLFIGYALTEPQSFNLVPVARDSVIDGMEDAYIVVNPDGQIVDSNPAARQLVGVEANWTGMQASQFFKPFSQQYERFRSEDSVETEISIRKDGETRYFDLNITPIDQQSANQQGTLVVLREITQLKHREQELREREEELDLLRQVQSRVLRHNIRNDLGVVRTYGEVLSEQLESEQEEMADMVVQTTDDLLSVSNKARSVEQLVEQDQEPTSIDITATLENTINSYRDRFPDVIFSLNAPDKCTIETIPAMELAIENIIENAAEHTDSDEKRVDVELDSGPENVLIRISDNGPGIPDHELEVLEEGEETDLKHGSGVGLWLIDWVRRNSNASITFESSDRGSKVSIRIPKMNKNTHISN